MSANNQLRIYQDKEGIWRCNMVDMDTGGIITPIADGEDLESVIRQANRFMENEEVEYGLKINTKTL